jgi:hypothetical protein
MTVVYNDRRNPKCLRHRRRARRALYYVDEDALARATRRRARGLFHSVGDLGEGGTGAFLSKRSIETSMPTV